MPVRGLVQLYNKNMFKNKKISLIIIIALSFLAVFNFTIAQTTSTTNTTTNTSSGTKTSTATLTNPLSVSTPGALIGNIIKTLMGVVGVIAVLMIVWGGVMYMTSAGNDEKIGTAKKIITGAIIGLVISILAYVIIDFVIKAIGG